MHRPHNCCASDYCLYLFLSAPHATHGRQNPTELLAYYRDRIALFSQERHEYAQKLEDCAVSREEYYKLRWELNQRDTEIAELQKALSDAHVYLYDEREHVLQLQAECDELKGARICITAIVFHACDGKQCVKNRPRPAHQ